MIVFSRVLRVVRQTCHVGLLYGVYQWHVVSLLCFLVISGLGFAQVQDAPAHQATEILAHIDRLWRGKTSHAQMTMTVNTARYKRTLSLEAWSLGAERSLVVIREPLKDRGVATLKVAANIWNYLPRIDRVTKIPSSMMSGAWMGSHFTNDDLVKESAFAEDYDAKVIAQPNATPKTNVTQKTNDTADQTRPHLVIRAVPKPQAHVVWGRVDIAVDASNYYPLTIKYFDEADHLVRTLTFDRVKKIEGRLIPLRLSLQPEGKPGENTEIVYEAIEFDVPLQPRFFSLQNLKNRN